MSDLRVGLGLERLLSDDPAIELRVRVRVRVEVRLGLGLEELGLGLEEVFVFDIKSENMDRAVEAVESVSEPLEIG